MIKTCTKCNKEFESKRDDARFCSSYCRLAFHRETDNSPVVETDKVSVLETDNPVVNETDNIQPVVVRVGYCHGCNEKQESSIGHLVCICHNCISKGITHESLGLNKCA